MGRSQSTPGLVESEGRITLEDMWLAPNELRTPRSLFSPSPSPITASSLHGLRAGVDTAVDTNTIGTAAAADRTRTAADSPMSATSSARSSEDQTARVPHSTTTQPSIGRQSTHSGECVSSLPKNKNKI